MIKKRPKRRIKRRPMPKRPNSHIGSRQPLDRRPVNTSQAADTLPRERIGPDGEPQKIPFTVKVKRKVHEFVEDLKTKAIAITFFLFAGIAFWLLIQLVFHFYGFSIVEWLKDLPFLYETFTYLMTEIKSKSDKGILYLFIISSLFFLPVPLEALYLNFLRGGFGFDPLFYLAAGGILAGQLINYFLGRFLGFIFIHFIKKKTRRDIKSKLSKYGAFAILFVHLIPFPFQIFNFICGILRYPFLKWLLFAAIGTALKHVIMYWLFVKFF